MLELHVWGPAFGLPSFDAHCLAAIAYLRQAIPPGEWVIVASSNPALSPTNELPALRYGTIWIGGFRNILNSIVQISSGKWDIDIGLSEQERADCIAFSCFLDSTAKILLDLSLYLSQENFMTVTRPVYRTLQPFPLYYFTPDAIRSTAQSRSQHLGLDCLNFDPQVSSNEASSAFSILPESLRPRPKLTVSSLLMTSPEKIAQIRLDELASNFFKPIEAKRNMKKYLISNTQMTSLDCLALGYLSLMLIPELPQAWLALNMRRKFPRLSAWIQELRTEIFGGAISTLDVFVDEGSRTDIAHHLPWRKPDSLSRWDYFQIYLSSLIEFLPGDLAQWRKTEKMKLHSYRTQKTQNSYYIKESVNDTDNNYKEKSWSSWKIIATTFGAAMILAVTTTRFGLVLRDRSKDRLLSEQEQLKKEEVNRTQDAGLNHVYLSTFEDAGSLLGAYAHQLDNKQSLEYCDGDREVK